VVHRLQLREFSEKVIDTKAAGYSVTHRYQYASGIGGAGPGSGWFVLVVLVAAQLGLGRTCRWKWIRMRRLPLDCKLELQDAGPECSGFSFYRIVFRLTPLIVGFFQSQGRTSERA
jgi:hypothetical protein